MRGSGFRLSQLGLLLNIRIQCFEYLKWVEPTCSLDHNIGTLHKSCVETVEEKWSIIDLEGAMKLGKKGKGVMIEARFERRKCLSVGAEFLDGWFLDWVDCAEAHEFVFREEKKDGLLIINVQQNKSLCVNFTLADTHNLGLIVIAYVASCDDDTLETSTQHLSIEPATYLTIDPYNTSFYSIFSGPIFGGYVLFLDENASGGRWLEVLALSCDAPAPNQGLVAPRSNT